MRIDTVLFDRNNRRDCSIMDKLVLFLVLRAYRFEVCQHNCSAAITRITVYGWEEDDDIKETAKRL